MMTRQSAVKEIAVPWEKPPPDAETSWPETRAEFEAFVRRYQDPLVRYAFRRLRHWQDAEDIVQEVFLRAYAQLGKGVARPAGYLYRMAANACTDARRRRRTEPLDPSRAEGIPDGRPPVGAEAEARDELDRIEALLACLPRRQAEVIRLHVYDGLSFGEAAQVVRRPTGTVKSRFQYGLRKLRKLLEQEVRP